MPHNFYNYLKYRISLLIIEIIGYNLYQFFVFWQKNINKHPFIFFINIYTKTILNLTKKILYMQLITIAVHVIF